MKWWGAYPPGHFLRQFPVGPVGGWGAVLATPCPQFPSSLPLCWGRLSLSRTHCHKRTTRQRRFAASAHAHIRCRAHCHKRTTRQRRFAASAHAHTRTHTEPRTLSQAHYATTPLRGVRARAHTLPRTLSQAHYAATPLRGVSARAHTRTGRDARQVVIDCVCVRWGSWLLCCAPLRV